jgi:hypothetical protein
MSHWPKIRPTIDELVNRQFETTEFKKLFAVPLTARRVEVYQNHMIFYANNRRDCWSFVAGKAPLDVKRAIWEHEKDELIHDDRMGRAHVTEDDLRLAMNHCLLQAQRRLITPGSTVRGRSRGSKGWFTRTFLNVATTTRSLRVGGWLSAGSASKEPSLAPKKRRRISKLRCTPSPTKTTRISSSRFLRAMLTAKRLRKRC